jgi:uncharacterized protein (TIGR03435 family)
MTCRFLARALNGSTGLRAVVTSCCLLTGVFSSTRALTADARPGPDNSPRQRDAAAAGRTFDVVSIRRNQSTTQPPTSHIDGGRYTAANRPLEGIISDAYQVQTRLMVGGPDWIRSARGPLQANAIRFAVIATLPPDASPDVIPSMLQTMLAQRFNLVVHKEMRAQPVYRLVHARNGKQLGPRLTRSTQQCHVEITSGSLRAPVKRVTEDGKPVCGMMLGRSIIGGGLTMKFLASALSGVTGRTVVDHTDLEGPFDFELRYAPPAGGAEPPPPSDQPSVFTAVQEQLGLKLEAANEPIEVLVIDQVSMPTEN